MSTAKNETYEVVKKSEARQGRLLRNILVLFIIASLSFITVEVYKISMKLSHIRISDEKVEYVYNKVGDLVNILNSKESSVSYNPTEKYDFKAPDVNQLVPEEPAETTENKEILKEELSRVNDSGKLQIVKDKLVDIYQKSKDQEDALVKLKQSFYDTKATIESWYNDKKNIGGDASIQPAPTENPTLVNKIKTNLSHFVDINKVNEDLSKPGKKILTMDQIPQLLSYAEVLLEAGSISQTVWILEDIQSITGQTEVAEFTKSAQSYMDKYPNSNIEMQQIKELIDIIENRE